MVDSYSPLGLTATEVAAFRAFILPLLIQAELTPTVARNVLRCVRYTAARPLRLGIGLSPQLVLSRTALEEFLRGRGASYSPEVQSRIRSGVTLLARALELPDYPLRGNQYPRTTRRAPYTERQAGAFYQLAHEQPEPLRTDALVLLDLAFHTGATTAQIRALQGRDVVITDDRVVVSLPHPTGVQLRPVYGLAARRLADRAADVGPDGFVLRPGNVRRHATEEVITQLARKAPALGRFRVQRAADAWTVALVELVPLPVVMAALNASSTSHTVLDLIASTRAVQPSELLDHLVSVSQSNFVRRLP